MVKGLGAPERFNFRCESSPLASLKKYILKGGDRSRKPGEEATARI